MIISRLLQSLSWVAQSIHPTLTRPSNMPLSLSRVYEVKQSPPLQQKVISWPIPAAKAVSMEWTQFPVHNSVTGFLTCCMAKLTKLSFDLSPWYFTVAVPDLKRKRLGDLLTPFIRQNILSSPQLTEPIQSNPSTSLTQSLHVGANSWQCEHPGE